MQIDAEALLLELLEIVGSARASPAQFELLVRSLKVPQGTPAVVFLSQVTAILRELDDRAFTDDRHRALLVKAALEALDEAIANEEDLLENAG